MNSIREVLRLHFIANLSARKIQGATGVARTTIQEYIKRCKESDIASYGELANLSDDSLNEKLFGVAPTTTSSNPLKIMPDYNYIHQEMKRKKKTLELVVIPTQMLPSVKSKKTLYTPMY